MMVTDHQLFVNIYIYIYGDHIHIDCIQSKCAYIEEH